jgi:hypothetical protein
MAVHFHPVDIPTRFYKPIGQIVTGWNLTEALISSIIWHIHKIKRPPVGRLFTYRLNSVEKLNILLSSARDYVSDTPLQGTLCKMYGEANAVRKERNAIAHGLWGRMPKEHSTWKVFYPREADDVDKTLMRRKHFTVKDRSDLARRVRKLNKDLKTLMAKYKIQPP